MKLSKFPVVVLRTPATHPLPTLTAAQLNILVSNYSDVIANQTGRLFLATSIFYVICPSSLGENITNTTSVLYSIKANTQSLTSVIIPSGKTSAVITSGSILLSLYYLPVT